MGYFRIMAAIPGFFLSSLFVMLLWDVVAPKIGITAVNLKLAEMQSEEAENGG
jgi:hypothetical protein